MLKMESFSGMLRPQDELGKLTFTVPTERRPEQSRVEIRYSPTLAGACVDALPYLASYPYGCTEQTLNRFVPTVVTQKILQRMKLDLAAIKAKRTNLNAQEIGDPAKRAEQWAKTTHWKHNPVFDNEEVTKMVKDGVQRLTEMQLSDGGWGWFSGFGEHSYPHTTAVVVHGLQLSKANDVALVPGMLEKVSTGSSVTKPSKCGSSNAATSSATRKRAGRRSRITSSKPTTSTRSCTTFSATRTTRITR